MDSRHLLLLALFIFLQTFTVSFLTTSTTTFTSHQALAFPPFFSARGSSAAARKLIRGTTMMSQQGPPQRRKGGGGGGGGGRVRPPRRDARRVAIIGGGGGMDYKHSYLPRRWSAGISGLACAKALIAEGLDPTVYDTGVHAAGGRCSSRILKVGDQEVLFDHSAQVIKVSQPGTEWADLMEEMVKAGVVRPWGGVGTVMKGGRFRPLSGGQAYCGVQGMRSVVGYLARDVSVERPKWVSKARLNQDTSWRLWHYNEPLGNFDYLVIAHNGKCAARLMKSPGDIVAPVQRLLDVKFGSRLKFNPPKQMQLCSMWVLLAYFPTPLIPPPDFEGAFVEGVPELSWISNNAAKLEQQGLDGTGGAWTIVSSPQFGEAHKVSQENVPDEKRVEVTRLLLSAFERALGISGGGGPQPVLRPAATFVQLWGAGNPISVADVRPDQAFLFQGSTNVGVCGDWLREPSLEGAALSGIQLAKHIASVSKERRVGAGPTSSPDVNLDCGFVAVTGGHPLGRVNDDAVLKERATA